MPRDEFTSAIKETLAKRVAFRCSNPDCDQITTGPHSDPARSVNLGVASHITAAARGGPRFDSKLTSEERASIHNGIWLCQRCAKLIDSDLTRYSVALLRTWKVAAETKVLRKLNTDGVSEYFPQPQSAVHAPLPRIWGLPYDEAREMLIQAGWQPHHHHWSHGNDLNFQSGNGLYFWAKGYWEIINAWPTGLARCTFRFHDVYGNFMIVTTEGEIFEEIEATANVVSWRFEIDQ